MSQIYLISPPKIDLNSFANQLEIALQTGKIPVFQLRLKGYEDQEIINIGKKLLKICNQYKTLFILNDHLDLALKIGAGGVHLGSDDGDIAYSRKNSPKNFVIGASCYDSKDLAVNAAEQGANYIAFGSFFPSKTKNSKGNPKPEILKWCDDFLNIPTVAIGGINALNCQPLIAAKADFLAVISYIWDNEKGVKEAISQLGTINSA